MKKIFLTASLCTGFFGMHASNEMLPKVQLFQEFNKACPRTVSTYQAIIKGMIEYSNESQDYKNCLTSYYQFIEDAKDDKNITTEEQAQLFATNLVSRTAQCIKVIQRDFSQQIDECKNNQLPLIKVVQQAMKAFPQEVQQTMMLAAIAARRDGDEGSQDALKILIELPTIATEEHTQNFTKKYLDKALQSPQAKAYHNALQQQYEAGKSN